MNMTCKIAMDLCELYHSRLVSEESARAVRQHLRGCENCRRYYKNYENVSRQKPTLRIHPADGIVDTEARLYASLSKRLRRRRFFEIVGTSATIGAGSIMLVAGLIMLSRSAHERG